MCLGQCVRRLLQCGSDAFTDGVGGDQHPEPALGAEPDQAVPATVAAAVDQGIALGPLVGAGEPAHRVAGVRLGSVQLDEPIE